MVDDPTPDPLQERVRLLEERLAAQERQMISLWESLRNETVAHYRLAKYISERDGVPIP